MLFFAVMMILPGVIDKSLPKLKVISKYGIGLDKIDTDYVAQKEIPLTFCRSQPHNSSRAYLCLDACSLQETRQGSQSCGQR